MLAILKCHNIIAKYFAVQPLYLDNANEKPNIRKLNEEPWQLCRAGEWLNLIQVLVSPAYFYLMHSFHKEFEWMRYWQDIKFKAKEDYVLGTNGIDIDIPNLYQQSFSNITDNEKTYLLGTLSQFLTDLGYYSAANQFLEEEAKILNNNKTEPVLLASNLNDQGLALEYHENHNEALELFKKAESIIPKDSQVKDALRLLASILMNQATSLRKLEQASEALVLDKRALVLMQETTGKSSPEVATVMQGIGNCYNLLNDHKNALTWYLKAYKIRLNNLGALHRDVGLSLGNLVNPLFGLNKYFYGITLCEKAAEIFKSILGMDHSYTVNMIDTISKCEEIVKQSINNKFPYGLVLLVFDSLPGSETKLDPLTIEGRKGISHTICNNLIEMYDNLFVAGKSIPILILSFPGYEDAVEYSLTRSIAKKISNSHLKWLHIPKINIEMNDPETLLPILNIRNQFLCWIKENSLEVIMVKPFTNIGSGIDTIILDYALHQKLSTTLNEKVVRPLLIETIEYDDKEGPLTGLHSDDFGSRTAIIPFVEWRKQKYIPQKGDNRVTGSFYLNLLEINRFLEKYRNKELTPLDEWSMHPLLKVATGDRTQQLEAYEKALSDLTILLNTGIISCPEERGKHGYQATSEKEFQEFLIAFNDLI